MMSDRPAHEQAAAAAAAKAKGFERTYNLIAMLRITCFIVLCVAGAGLIGGAGALALAVVGVALAGFLALALWHVTIDDQRRVARQLATYHQQGVERMAGQWQHGQEDGSSLIEGDHAYARDLDVVGASGLYQLLNTAGSALGQQRLADWVLERSSPPTDVVPKVQALVADHDWRAALATAAHDETALGAEDPIAQWLQKRPAAPGSGSLALIWGVRIVVPVLLTVAYLQVGGSGLFWTAIVLMGLLFPVDGMARAQSAAIDPIIGRRRVRALARALAVVGTLPAGQSAVASLRERAQAAQTGAAEIASLCGTLAQGANAVRAGLGALWMVEWAGLRRLHQWADRHGDDYAAWCELLSDVEAIACIATYAAEQGGVWTTEPSEQVMVQVEDLAHPLLPRDERVGNSIELRDGQVLLLTGANASGKSTFLRALALAATLARVGAPVPATACAMRPLQVATVMRVGDDLRSGKSRFQAEVERLRDMLVVSKENNQAVLLAFDEILSGTNSQERHLGTKAVLDALRGRRGVVMVSTHDLELAQLAEAEPERFILAHFADRAAMGEEDADADMVFDYQLRPGVLQSTNALRVMKAYGLPVDGVDAEPGSVSTERT